MLRMRTTPPFRADHVGSLLRPASVLAARDDFAAGRITAHQLRAVEDAAIADVVAMQQNAGLQSATDGEFRRASWHMDFIYQIGGVSKAPGNLAVKFHNPSGDIEFTPAALHVGTKIHMARTIFEEDFTYLKSLAGDATAKLTIPSPNMVHYRGGPAAIDPEVYPDIEEFWSDLSAAYADEVARLAALGCTYLQFDGTSLAYLNDPVQRAGPLHRVVEVGQAGAVELEVGAAQGGQPGDLVGVGGGQVAPELLDVRVDLRVDRGGAAAVVDHVRRRDRQLRGGVAGQRLQVG